jgi:hypothetical protein
MAGMIMTRTNRTNTHPSRQTKCNKTPKHVYPNMVIKPNFVISKGVVKKAQLF